MNRAHRPILAAAVLLVGLASSASGQFAHDPATGRYYLRTPSAANFATARTQAANVGGHLASIGSADEQALLEAAFAPFMTLNAHWIGLSDSVTEGVWAWDDGTPYSYANWYPGEPNNAADEDAAAMLPVSAGYRWNDFPTSGTAFGIVEIDAPLAGDVPESATAVSGSTTVPYSSTGYVLPGILSGAAAPCSNNNSPTPRDRWFRYDATTTGVLTISNCSSSVAAPGGSTSTTDDTFLAVFTAESFPPTNLVTCSDGSPQCGVSQSEVTFATVAGQSYLVQLGPWNGASAIAGVLAFKFGIDNDDCASALPLALGVNGPYTNAPATDAPVLLNCETAGHDVWFSYASPEAAEVSITTETPPGATPGSLVDPNLQVFAGCGGPLLACVDDNPGVPLTAKFDVAAGQTVYVRVAGWLNTSGTFRLTVGSAQRVLRLTSPAGPGSLQVEHRHGQPFEIYLTVFTLTPGAYPHGWYYGVDPTPTEFLLQAATFAPPFLGVLDAAGHSSFGPLLGAPPLTLYAATAFFSAAGVLTGASAPTVHTIP